jgi:hypothetical protein
LLLEVPLINSPYKTPLIFSGIVCREEGGHVQRSRPIQKT